MNKGSFAEALAKQTGLKRSKCAKVIRALDAVATQELKGEGKFTLPAHCMVQKLRQQTLSDLTLLACVLNHKHKFPPIAGSKVKTCKKPNMQATKQSMIGKSIVKAKYSKKVVKALPEAATHR